MSDRSGNYSGTFVDLASDIVAAYISNNSVPTSELPSLIQGVHTALKQLASGSTKAAPEELHEKATPAQIRKSVTPGGLVSFLDGKSYKTLKRHLAGYNLDPHSYRQRYGLPADYPMVAADYAAHRSALAKSIGLGRVADRSEEPQPKTKGSNKAA